MADVAPTFGAWVRREREARGWGVADLAAQAGLPRSTVASFEARTRRGGHPRPEVARRIAAAFRLPILAVAVVAGYAEPDPGAPDLGEDLLLPTSGDAAWWGRTTGACLRDVRATAGVDAAGAAARWSRRWTALAITGGDWAALEDDGRLPAAWAGTVEGAWASQLPGPWIWGVVWAAGGDAVDVAACAFAAGRLPRWRCAAWQAGTDYEQLAGAFRTAVERDRFDARAFYERARAVRWTVPVAEPRAATASTGRDAGRGAAAAAGTDRLTDVVWAYLAREFPGIDGVRDDARLAAVVRAWARLPAEIQSRVVALVGPWGEADGDTTGNRTR